MSGIAPAARRGPGGLARRAVRIARDGGPGALLFAVLGDLGYRRLLVLARGLGPDEPIPELASSLPLRFERFPGDALDEYLAFHDESGRAQLERRLRSGDECFVARHEGRIACATWTTYRTHHVRYLGYDFPVREGEVHFYDTYTDPELRGRGVAAALGVELLRRCREAGLRRATVTTLPENRANRRARAKAGFRACAVVRSVGLGPWRRHFVQELR